MSCISLICCLCAGVKPHFALEAFSDLAEDVRQNIRRIKGSPYIPHTTNVRGFIYSVTTGAIDEVLLL